MKFHHLPLLVLICISVLLSSCNNQKQGYINASKLVQGYHGAAVQRQVLLQQAQTWEANLDSLNAELKTLPLAQKAAKEQQFQQYRAALQQQAQATEARVNQTILTEVNTYIKQYGKQHGYAFILGATEQGNLVYADVALDLTDEILTGLNQQYDQQRAGKP